MGALPPLSRRCVDRHARLAQRRVLARMQSLLDMGRPRELLQMGAGVRRRLRSPQLRCPRTPGRDAGPYTMRGSRLAPLAVTIPYGGMDPAQMEGYLTYYYEYHFLYITGIDHVESKSIQGAALMKLVFHPDTNMSQAMSETVGYVNRARAFMPPGTVPPFITRFDAGSVAVGLLIFSSAAHSQGEMQDYALNRVRPLFATLPGVSAPPPFGGNQRTIVVMLDPAKLQQYRISPEEAIAAVSRSSVVMPSGNMFTGKIERIARTNSALGANLADLLSTPIRPVAGATVYLRDIGTIENGTDIVTAYAHVNGKRTVYIPVTKRAA